jgi:8-oxo-dGTP pyrophosphatase MutT (NUDIX family)
VTFMDLSEAEIRRKLATALADRGSSVYPEFAALTGLLSGSAKPAAVLVPFQRTVDGWQVVFTRRNPDLPEHSGQVAFPGGRSDPEDDSPEATALREAQEEIGLKPDDVRILGRMHDFLTVTNYRVTPVVGVIPYPYGFQPYELEVSRVFSIPLEWLANPSNHEIRERKLPAPFDPVPVIYFSPYEGEILWGATARFMMSLLEILSLK